MATPVNPLDVFATYIYHFELHASHSWDELKTLDGSQSNEATDRFEPNGTLLINTRRDAHQIIDDVQFQALSPAASRSGIAAVASKLDMIVTEPGGFGFIEKLNVLMERCETKELGSLVFALRIMFVGRRPDNSVETMYSKLVPLTLFSMNGTFDHRGGVYNMSYIATSSVAATSGENTGPQMRYSYTDKNVAFEANTVQEALTKLAEKLNINYEETYRNKLDRGEARKLVYKINFDKEISGEVNGTVKRSFALDDANSFSFDPKKEISACINDILHRSRDINAKIGAAAAAYEQDRHKGAWMPVIVPRIYPKDDVVEIVYDIEIYRGGGTNEYIFDYYFSDAGKNVDVMQFDVVFSKMFAALPTSSNKGTDKYVNLSATCSKEVVETYSLDIVHSDVTKHRNESLRPEKRKLNFLKNDVAPLITCGVNDRNGHNIHTVGDVKDARLAIDTASAFLAATGNTQSTFVIRGHLDFLNLCCGYPDGSVIPYGVKDGLWIKINIYMPAPDGTRRQFYYTGWYQVFGITNQFSGGKFTQSLVVQAIEQPPQ
jgi:hypothetical protein